MKTFKKCLIVFPVALALASSAQASRSLEDVVSITALPDGTFGVVCKDGSYEVATQEMVKEEKVCEKEAPHHQHVKLGLDSFFEASGAGVGQGRATSFRANTDFSIESVSIKAEIIPQLFDVEIFSSDDGLSAKVLLLKISREATAKKHLWNEIPISYDFKAGKFYVVNWQPTKNDYNWAKTVFYEENSLFPAEVGPVTLISGFSGKEASGKNIYHPPLRLKLAE